MSNPNTVCRLSGIRVAVSCLVLTSGLACSRGTDQIANDTTPADTIAVASQSSIVSTQPIASEKTLFTPVVATEGQTPLCCSEEGCHALSDEIGTSPEHLKSLLLTLYDVDPEFAARIEKELLSGSERPRDVLDRFCLVEVSINPESRVKVDTGQAGSQVRTGEWETYLIKVQNLAGITSPLMIYSEQRIKADEPSSRLRWVELEILSNASFSHILSGDPLEYRILRLKTDQTGRRSAVVSLDVGQGTADIGFRNDVVLNFNCLAKGSPSAAGQEPARARTVEAAAADVPNARLPRTEAELERWLQNMVWHHHYSLQEIRLATGLTVDRIQDAIQRFGITAENRPDTKEDNELTVLPYPGGRHPRIGFLDGAIDPQRETKVSVFTPWDSESYVVCDTPEAIWSNLGLTYLAHTHIPTIWDRRSQQLDPQEWSSESDGGFVSTRRLPNGIEFTTTVQAADQIVYMDMTLTNGTDETLTDLRVQNCVMLKMAAGFAEQTNENKVFWGPYAACRNAAGNRWIITAWTPLHRGWANADCPCLHADPQFPDCPPGKTSRIFGMLSFYEGDDIYAELARLDTLNWRRGSTPAPSLHGVILDDETNEPVAARIYIQDSAGDWFEAETYSGKQVAYRKQPEATPEAEEVHTTLPAESFFAALPAGTYQVRIERGKEYLPCERTIEIGDSPVAHSFRLQRWTDMAARGWYSGDTHVHRELHELPVLLQAEDLNVAFPLTSWVTRENELPPVDPSIQFDLQTIDETHVFYPRNTEYELVEVGGVQKILGAFMILNHRSPLPLPAMPTRDLGKLVEEQGALIDFDKHSWLWSSMVAPIMEADLYELSNNHVWPSGFGLKTWALDSAGQYMNAETDAGGFTEWGWLDYGFQNYYAFLNCGLRMRVSAGTASGVHPVPLGYSRVYVHLPDGFKYDNWIAGLDDGHSFATTGPLLDLRFNGLPPGSEFHRSSPEDNPIHITGACLSSNPLDRIEIIVNGEIDQILEPENNPAQGASFQTDLDVTVNRSGSYWIAVRCFEADTGGRVSFAHTNPVFVDVDGHPLLPRAQEVNYLITRTTQAIAELKDLLVPEKLSEYEQALKFYQDLAVKVQNQ